MNFYDRNKRHFRGRYTKVKGKIKVHPNYIVGEDGSDLLSLGITHDPLKGKKHKNYKMVGNPKKGDNSVSYMKKQIVSANKKNYTDKWNNYRIHPKDDEFVDKIVEKHKKNN